MLYAVTVDTTGAPLTEDQLLRFIAAPVSAILSGAEGYDRISATMTINASDALVAGREAIDKVTLVRGEVDVDALEILTADEQDRRLAAPARSW